MYGKGWTAYNAFVSHGMHAEPVYLTRWQTRNGACVVNSVRVSEGTLRSIAVSDDGTAYATDIALGRLTVDDGTTVGQLAAAIVCNNDDFCFNDALWFYVAFQRENPATGLPEAECSVCALRSTRAMGNRCGRALPSDWALCRAAACWRRQAAWWAVWRGCISARGGAG